MRLRAWWAKDWLDKKEIKARLYEQQHGRCASCSCRLILSTPLLPRSAELDHIKPKAHRGKDDEENYQLLCRGCNGQKSDKEPDVFKKLYNAEPGTLKIRL